MPRISSNWKLTFDPAGTPLVLLNYTDLIEGEPRFPLAKALEVIPIAEADPLLRDQQSRVHTIQFEVYASAASDQLARRAIMESLVAAGPLGRKPLRLQINGITDRYWQYASAFIEAHNPGMYVEPNVARLVKGWTIKATGLSQVGP
jgi:hypothetical protein